MSILMWSSFAVAAVFLFILWRDLANVRAARRREAVDRIYRSLAPIGKPNVSRLSDLEYFRPMGAVPRDAA